MVEEIKEHALAYSIAIVDAETVDKINIRQASLKAMRTAINNLEITPEYILVDGSDIVPNLNILQRNVIQGDYYSHSISAASLLAKEFRDNLMASYDEAYDNKYEWSKNAGYPTKRHIELVNEHGVTPQHRKTWKTMSKITSALKS